MLAEAHFDDPVLRPRVLVELRCGTVRSGIAPPRATGDVTGVFCSEEVG
jgi:hypothetical protein